MTVPSYDDLTPGIPDVTDSDAAGNLASLLVVGPQLPASGSQLRAFSSRHPGSGLYACLRLGADSGEPKAESRQLEAVLAIARDFSPRVRQASGCEVLLDVSGLGRLIGPPAEIGRQLARALAEAAMAGSVAIGPTQTVARLLAHAEETGHGLTLRHKDHEDHKDHEAYYVK